MSKSSWEAQLGKCGNGRAWQQSACVLWAPSKPWIINCFCKLGSVLRFLLQWCIFQRDSCAALEFVSPLWAQMAVTALFPGKAYLLHPSFHPGNSTLLFMLSLRLLVFNPGLDLIFSNLRDLIVPWSFTSWWFKLLNTLLLGWFSRLQLLGHRVLQRKEESSVMWIPASFAFQHSWIYLKNLWLFSVCIWPVFDPCTETVFHSFGL